MKIRAIKTEAGYHTALKRLEEVNHSLPDTVEGDEAEVLSILIEKYEAEHYPVANLGIVKGNPNNADDSHEFLDGSIRSKTVLRTATIGYGTYKPGWRWSEHAGPQTGKQSENHIGYIISGRMKVIDPFGNEVVIEPGCAFEIMPGSDAWVVGKRKCVTLDFIPLSNTRYK